MKYTNSKLGTIIVIFSNFSSLVFAGASSGDIVRYFLDNGTQEVVHNNNRSARFLSVDSEYEVIYWIDFIAANDSYSLMKTYFNGSNSQVNYYPGTTRSVKIAIGKDDFYVMDSTRGRIDRFDRSTVSLQNTFYLSDTPEEFTIVQGKAYWPSVFLLKLKNSQFLMACRIETFAYQNVL
jgi:hypothetical protein